MLKVNFLGTIRGEIRSIRSYMDGTYNIFRSLQTLQYNELPLYGVLAAAIWLRYKLNTQWCSSEKSRFVSKGKIYIFMICHLNFLPLDNKVLECRIISKNFLKHSAVQKNEARFLQMYFYSTSRLFFVNESDYSSCSCLYCNS